MTFRPLAVLALAASFVCAPAAASDHASRNKPRKHVMVQFSDMSVHPKIAQVLPGGSVVWINYSTMYRGVISFPLSTASSFTCSELRPIFSKTADRIQSIPVTGDMENVALPCPLKPGEYDYKIDLFSGELGGLDAGMYDPERSMDGKIIVK